MTWCEKNELRINGVVVAKLGNNSKGWKSLSPSRLWGIWRSRRALLQKLWAPPVSSWRPACHPACSSWTPPRSRLKTERETTEQCSHQQPSRWERTSLRYCGPRFYLEECHPGEFIVALHRVPEVVLQCPELPVQVVVDGNGAENRNWIKFEQT